jgi:hypothetical protein
MIVLPGFLISCLAALNGVIGDMAVRDRHGSSREFGRPESDKLT